MPAKRGPDQAASHHPYATVMPPIVFIADVPGLYPAAPYAYATQVASDALLLTAGACPLDKNGIVVEPGDRVAQTRRVLDNLEAVLRQSDASIGDVVKTTVYVVARDQADLLTVWDVVAERFASTRPPSTLLGVAVLGYRDQLVEIEAVATLHHRHSTTAT